MNQGARDDGLREPVELGDPKSDVRTLSPVEERNKKLEAMTREELIAAYQRLSDAVHNEGKRRQQCLDNTARFLGYSLDNDPSLKMIDRQTLILVRALGAVADLRKLVNKLGKSRNRWRRVANKNTNSAFEIWAAKQGYVRRPDITPEAFEDQVLVKLMLKRYPASAGAIGLKEP